jgi:hypothetical protein
MNSLDTVITIIAVVLVFVIRINLADENKFECFYQKLVSYVD